VPTFSKRSQTVLSTLHEDLQDICNIVIQHRDCTLLEGTRDVAAQQKAFDEGKSKARPGKSPHNFTPSFAVDIAPYPIPDWNNPDPEVKKKVQEDFLNFATFVKGVAAGLGVGLTWGGDFKSFYDGPHFELTNWLALSKLPPSPK